MRWHLKKHTTIKRLSALALALLLAMALLPAAPAKAAADSYQVRIYPNPYTSIPTGSGDEPRIKRFKAYQILSGTIDDTKYQVGEKDPFSEQQPINEQPVANELSDPVHWGSGISPGKIESLLTALITEDTFVKDMSFPSTEQLIERLLNSRTLYLQAPGLRGFYDAHEDEENWVDGIVDGTLTATGEANLRSALTEDLAKGTLTFGHLLVGALLNAGYFVEDNIVKPGKTDEVSTLDYTSAMVTRVLKDFTNPEKPYSREFADDFAKKVSRKGVDGNYLYLDNAAGIPSAWTDAEGYWTLDLPAGYYFIVDTYTTDAAGSYNDNDPDNGTAQSDFIVSVFGSQYIQVKTSAPTVEKVITNYGGGDASSGDFEIGETVKFRITGTLPENYDGYRTYRYRFTDTLPAGLSYQAGSMKVYALDPGGARHPLELDGNLTVTGFTGADPNSAVVEFSDLKAFAPQGLTRASEAGDRSSPITAGWKFVIEYEATLNNKADYENKTDVYLTYSSSSINLDNTANTTKSANYIYNFGIHVLKYYETFVQSLEDDDPGMPLPGAGFALTKDNRYALFDEDGVLSGWIDEGSIDWDSVTAGGGKISDTEHLYFITGGDGKILFRGMKAGTGYVLREVVVPENCDKPEEDPTITLYAKYGEDRQLSGLSCTVRGGNADFIGIDDKHVANLEVINYPLDALLDTGGPGTVLFYSAGGALLAGAAGILIFSHTKKRRKSGKRVRYINIKK